MAKCDLTIHLEDPREVYHPGDTVSGRVEVRTDDEVKCDGLEVSCNWRTHGKGNTARGDRGEMNLFQGTWRPGTVESYAFTFEIPEGPYSYNGHYLNVAWELKATADIPWAFDPEAELEITVAPSPDTPDYDESNLPVWMSRADSLSDALRQARQMSSTAQAQRAATGGAPQVPGVPGGSGSDDGLARAQEMVEKHGKGMKTLGVGCVILFLLPFAIAAVVVLVMTGANLWGWYQGEAHFYDLVPWLIGSSIILLIVGIPGMSLLRKYLASKKLGEVKWKVEPGLAQGGEEIRITVDATAQDRLELNSATARIEAREVVVRGSGTNRSTYHHTVFEKNVEIQGARVFRRGQPLHFTGSVALPADAPYSFDVSDNGIEWKVHLRLDIASWPDWVDSREFLVHP